MRWVGRVHVPGVPSAALAGQNWKNTDLHIK
jgi:hypothetical protein